MMDSARPKLVSTVAVGSLLVGLFQVYVELDYRHGLTFYATTAGLVGRSKYYLIAQTLIPIGFWLASGLGLWLGQAWGWWLSAFHYFLGVARHLRWLSFDVLVLQVQLNPDLAWSSGIGGTLLAIALFFALIAFVFRVEVRRWAGVQGSSLTRLVVVPCSVAALCVSLSLIYEVASGP